MPEAWFATSQLPISLVSCANFEKDLCNSALDFAFDTLRKGGSFVCKFYQGTEDKMLEMKLKTMFGKVHREKPASSRSVRVNCAASGIHQLIFS